MRPAWLLLLLLALVTSCRKHAAPKTRPEVRVERSDWGALPRTNDALRGRLATARTRTSASFIPTTAFAVTAALSRTPFDAVAGSDAVMRAIDRRLPIDRDAMLLVGTHHDARGQIDLFRRLAIAVRFTHLFAEPIQAASGWSDAKHDGDDVVLARFLARGDRADLEAFAALQRAHDYAAFKFDWLPSIVELAVTARGLGVPLFGCDLPNALRPALEGDDLARLRELHAFLSVSDAIRRAPSPRRIAMLWGSDHVGEGAFVRFVPDATSVVVLDVLGERPLGSSATSIDAELAKGFTLVDPVLLPLDERHLVLILPDARLGGDVDRVRTQRAPRGAPAVEVRSDVAGTLTVGSTVVTIEADTEKRVPLAAGTHAYRFAGGGRSFVGALDVPTGGEAELEIDVARRSIRVVAVAAP